jgi:flagellar motor switch protein FliN/FliY
MTQPTNPGAVSAPAAAPLDELVPTAAAGAVEEARLDSLLDMTLPVTIEFGRTTLSIQEVLGLGPGAVVQLDRLVGEAVDVYVSDRRLAEGEVVIVGDHFGVRITRILTNGTPGGER